MQIASINVSQYGFFNELQHLLNGWSITGLNIILMLAVPVMRKSLYFWMVRCIIPAINQIASLILPMVGIISFLLISVLSYK